MSEMNVLSVCCAVVVCAVVGSIATYEIKTAGVDTQRKATAQIEACTKHGGTYILSGNGGECIAPCGASR